MGVLKRRFIKATSFRGDLNKASSEMARARPLMPGPTPSGKYMGGVEQGKYLDALGNHLRAADSRKKGLRGALRVGVAAITSPNAKQRIANMRYWKTIREASEQQATLTRLGKIHPKLNGLVIGDQVIAVSVRGNPHRGIITKAVGNRLYLNEGNGAEPLKLDRIESVIRVTKKA